MISRRSFFGWSFATGLGLHTVGPAISAEKPPGQRLFTPNEFELALAKYDSLDVIGRPRTWSLVEKGQHPISPERVIVMKNGGGDGWSSRDRHLEASIRASLNEQVDLSACKMDPIFRLMQVMTDYYRVRRLFPAWATNLAKRESLATTSMGYGFGLLHQFQDDGLLQLMNDPVDWWLVLFPDGIDWESIDDKPVFGMIGHVFPPRHMALPGLKCHAWELTARVGRCVAGETEIDAWRLIARMDRITAAQVVNRAILGCGCS
jgi:hypothetical protein